MFDEVLKFGAAIVDGLVNYEQPVFVYIPPFAELRGGAWAVVDPTINEGNMEMYADPQAQGGVLEPAGLIEIKYRKKQLLETIHRLDDKIKQAHFDKNIEGATILAEIKTREEMVLPIYVQVATEFGDLHDTPGRMKSVGCIRQIISWANSRKFFYWRLKRQLSEFSLRRQIVAASAGGPCATTCVSSEQVLKGWLTEEVNGGRVPRQQNQEQMASQVVEIGRKDPKAAVAGILKVLNLLSDKARDEAVAALPSSTSKLIGV
ncbi:hypothetical protein PsorP6_014305 [Peronosclerospora sorghi]|uniref:Uncharacterized protein n=1 Tax=Peronosclerospora sorghi TaxID=230839 RepID=A0ACC0VGZ7_9STRA|nr:hypothetical protein PsorP6_014305 [Peronosclerospora sorghi]